MNRRLFPVLMLATLTLPSGANGQDSSSTKVVFGGFIDTYYAYDFGRPMSLDRSFTTQPARHNEFNVNLAQIDATVEGNGFRARLALQAGTSVQSNYAAEPTVGAISGGNLSRHLQEAVVGVRVGDQVWVDAGVYLSHIGSESWISRDNPTYTRSLNADYSPYYQAGVKLTWTPTRSLTAQVDLINGWQIISENNGAKAIGFRVDYLAGSQLTLSTYNFIGNEIPTGGPGRTRYFQGVTARLTPSSKSLLVATFDFGFQRNSQGDHRSSWYGGALIGRYQASTRVGVSARIERYADQDQIIVATGGPLGLRAWGGSFGLDVAAGARVLWRTEWRGLHSPDRIFPNRDGAGGLAKTNAVLVTSLGVTI